MNTSNKKKWAGGFSSGTAKEADSFNSSLPFDKRLYKYDIEGNIAHAKMLGATGIITPDESKIIVSGLSEILTEIESGVLVIEGDEDIHMWVESRLTEKTGDAGKKVHTARSRNDQVALDIRLYLRDDADKLSEKLKKLLSVLLSLSEKHLRTYMTGFTHMQHAQPITLAHHLTAYAEMFSRDIERLADCKKRANIMPLGSGALAATTFPIDREMTARLLNFDGVSGNSLDAVSDRDFLIEYVSALSIIMMHLSRLSEELILWATTEFGFLELSDAYSTGSSQMPNKKNPDMLELIRGKTGRVFGSLTAILTVMKGLPLAYNKDMQEDKEAVFNASDTVSACLDIVCPVLETASFNVEALRKSALRGFAAATEVADFLVRAGLPFRDAHEVSGKLKKYCVENSKELETLTLDEFKNFSPLFIGDIFQALNLENIVDRRKVTGGPAPETVKANIKALRKRNGI